jgi:hypothetical protein
MTDNEPQKTIEQRIEKDKEALIEQLKKVPIVQFACEKVGVGRTTYYRWRKEDPRFVDKAEEAMGCSRDLVNEMAESQIITQLKGGNLTAAIFWLKNNHKLYKPVRYERNDVIRHTEAPPPEVIAEIDRLFAKNSKCSDCGKSLLEDAEMFVKKSSGI